MTIDNPTSQFLARPFAALRPDPAYAQAVAAPPYDVMNAAEARQLAAGRPHSFLHVSRAEIDLDPGIDPYSDAVYTRAAANLDELVRAGVLVQDNTAQYYVYRISSPQHSVTGLALAASVEAYRSNRIRRHELTRPAKETDRVNQIVATGAITGPVMLVHRASAELAAITGDASSGASLLEATVDGWTHNIWPIAAPTQVERVSALLNAMPALYIADGHHRSAAALRVADVRTSNQAAPCDAFLAVTFADNELRILDYNRVVADLNGLSDATFLERLAADFEVTPVATPVRPAAALEYGLYLGAQWYALRLRDTAPATDVIARLDVSVLDRLVLQPILGIGDPRTDPRIDFVGGSRGVEGVASRVDAGGMAAGFTLFPTTMADLLAVADANRIMPPKSTWFEPKLADGLLSLPLPPA